MYFSEGLLLQNLPTQLFLIIKCYKEPFFLPGSYGFLFSGVRVVRHLARASSFLGSVINVEIFGIVSTESSQAGYSVKEL